MVKKILSFGVASVIIAGTMLSSHAMIPSEKVEASGDVNSVYCVAPKINSRIIIWEDEFLKFSKDDNSRNLLSRFLKMYSEVSYWDKGNTGLLKFYSNSRENIYMAYIIKNYKCIKNLKDVPSSEVIAMKKPFCSEKISDLKMNFISLSKKYISQDYFMFFEDSNWMVSCTTDFWNSTELGLLYCNSQVVCDFIDKFVKLNDFGDTN
ncbi:MAG: hypothetical protein ACI4PR_00495 [Acutalibacteraceae bacterium]